MPVLANATGDSCYILHINTQCNDLKICNIRSIQHNDQKNDDIKSIQHNGLKKSNLKADKLLTKQLVWFEVQICNTHFLVIRRVQCKMI